MAKSNHCYVVLYLTILFTAAGFLLFKDRNNVVQETVYRTTEQCSENKDDLIPSSAVLMFQDGSFSVNDSATEQHLVNYIRRQLLGPSLKPQILTKKRTHFSQVGQSKHIDKLLKGRRNGFFVECGAADGVAMSNSLFFERSRNWTGLLVEANPFLFQGLLRKNRKAYQIHACLSPTREPREFRFKPARFIGGIDGYIGKAHKQKVKQSMQTTSDIGVQCFSLYHIMKALGRDHIDYFSLDVEGAELSIMKTVPWDKLRIDVLTVEYNGNGQVLNGFQTYLESTGLYKFSGKIGNQDAVFVRKDLNV